MFKYVYALKNQVIDVEDGDIISIGQIEVLLDIQTYISALTLKDVMEQDDTPSSNYNLYVSIYSRQEESIPVQ